MVTNHKRVIFSIIIIYLIIYFTLCVIGDYNMISVIKPLPSFMAYYAIRRFIIAPSEKKEKYTYLSVTLLIWFIVDFLSSFGEVIGKHLGMNLNILYNIEFILYASVRGLILLLVIRLYWDVTSVINRFQRFCDIITMLNCLCATLWIIFVRGKTDYVMDEKFIELIRFDSITVLSFLDLAISLSILGMLLLTWFHMKNRAIPIGQRLLLIGTSGISIGDILLALNNSYIGKNLFIDILYKTSLWIIVLAAIFYRSDTILFKKRKKAVNDKKYGTWVNGFYLLVYPAFTISVVGFHPTTLLYLLMIAFYMMSCLYVKQIAVTDNLLVMEKIYNEQLKLYSSVLVQAPLSIVITDIDGNIQYSNPYFTKISGYSSEEALGKNPRILKSEKTPSSTYDKLWSTVTRGATWRGDFININKYGQEYQESAVIIPIKNEQAITTHYVAIKENVSETLRIKSQLSDQNYFTSQLLDTIPSGIFYVSVSDIFLGANAEYKRIYGIHINELNGTKVSEAQWMTGEYYHNYSTMKEEAIKNNAPCIRQITRKLHNGEEAVLLYSLGAFYLSDGTLGGFLGVLTDITELKKKEKDLEVALIQANAATEVKSQFLANMSHEIRTPMNAIIGMSYLALKSEMDLKQREYIQYINSAATSLLGIINDILDFSKIESGKLELEQIEFDLDAVILNSINLLSQKAYEKQLEILYKLSLNMPHRLIGDPLRLGQIITNLVSNAIKFTSSGEVQIDVTEEQIEGDRICVKFSVRDTGIGILEENRNKLFEAFTQSDSSTTRQFGGTGLGLTICQRLVEMMNGKIWVTSEFGKGSIFSFNAYFHFNEDSQINYRIPANITDRKVLVVDDNTTARSILYKYLRAMGFLVDAVSDGIEALYMIMKNDLYEPYGIVFADLRMPEMDGALLFKKINELEYLEHMPIMILMAGDDRSELISIKQEVKFDSLLSKPISLPSLYDCIINLHSDNRDNAKDDLTSGDNENEFFGKRILLVEDNDLNQKIAYELLVRRGISVDIAGNGREAVNILLTGPDKPIYDLVLMDLQMPEMDGFDATRKIRRIYQELPIIAMSARTMQEEKSKCFQVGMNDHIAKPIDPKDLFDTIHKWTSFEHSGALEDNPKDVKLMQGQPPIHIVIQGIDTESGIRRASDDVELYHQLLRNYVIEQAGMIKDIRKELSGGNYLAVEQYSHKLKGVSGNIGATEIYSICSELERIAGTTKELAHLNGLCNELEIQARIIEKSVLEYSNELGLL